MNWVWIAAGTWVVVAVLVSGVIGRAIRSAEREEVGHGTAGVVPGAFGGEVVPLPTARRPRRSHVRSRTRSTKARSPLAAGRLHHPGAAAPRRSDQA